MSPRPHQQLGINHLLTHQQAALFMGLGLGKTLTVLTAFDGLLALGYARTMLVVAPVRVCNLTWPNEIAKWPQFAHLRVANLRTKQGWREFMEDTAQVYLCNYEMLHKLVERVNERCPDVVVFDELTRAKNPQSKRINALRKVLPPHIRRWGLTGTPTPNSLMELFAQIRLLDEGKRLGRSYSQFLETYFHTTDYMGYNWAPNPGTPEKIYGKISDIALTLLSSEFLKIPDCVVEDIDIALPEEARDQYRTLEKELLLSLGDGDEIVVAPSAAVLVNKLLQVVSGAVYVESNHPEDIKPKDKPVVFIHDKKIVALKQFLKTHPEPVLIAYNYRHELDRLRQALPNAAAFEDATTPEQQSNLERTWNEGKVARMLVHPASVGHGLNLQDGGSTVAWFSPTWSRELYDQLNGRVIRSGQTRVQRIVRFLCPGTIEDAVVETLHNRDEGQKALLHTLANFRRMLEK